MRRLLAGLVIVAAACSGGGVAVTSGDLPAIDGPGIRAVLADLDQPAVVNVWASWCLPCRAEAPLLAAAHDELGHEVTFIGIDVQDVQAPAQDFIAEFGLDFVHYFDPDRAVPTELGGFGLPITYFVAPGGEVLDTHSGILDEETLADRLDGLTG